MIGHPLSFVLFSLFGRDYLALSPEISHEITLLVNHRKASGSFHESIGDLCCTFEIFASFGYHPFAGVISLLILCCFHGSIGGIAPYVLLLSGRSNLLGARGEPSSL